MERIDDLSGFEQLANSWKELLRRSPQRNLFLTHEFASCWWKHFGAARELWLLLVRDGPDPLAIAPLMRTHARYGGLPVRMLSLFRNKHTTRGDLLLGDPDREAVVELGRYLRRHQSRWDVLFLEGVPAASPSLTRLPEELGWHGMRTFPPRDHCSLFYASVSCSWDEFLANRTRRLRRTIKHDWNLLTRDARAEFQRETELLRVESSMERLFELSSRGWKARSAEAALDSADRRFHLDLARQFAARFGFANHFLRIDGEDAAAFHTLSYDQVQYLFLTAFSPAHAHRSPGSNVLRRILFEACEDPMLKEVDFNGSGDYLSRWSAERRELQTLTACNGNPYSRLLTGLRWLRRRRAAQE